MTTGLDIIDTAVKIGLGALISGLATYFVSAQKHDHELQNDHRKRKMDLLEKIAIGLQKATTNIVKTVHVYLENITKNKDEIKKIISGSLDEYLHAIEELNFVDGYASLLGEEELSTGLEELNNATIELYAFFLSENVNNHTEFNKIIHKINAARDKLPNILSKIYAK